MLFGALYSNSLLFRIVYCFTCSIPYYLLALYAIYIRLVFRNISCFICNIPYVYCRVRVARRCRGSCAKHPWMSRAQSVLTPYGTFGLRSTPHATQVTRTPGTHATSHVHTRPHTTPVFPEHFSIAEILAPPAGNASPLAELDGRPMLGSQLGCTVWGTH